MSLTFGPYFGDFFDPYYGSEPSDNITDLVESEDLSDSLIVGRLIYQNITDVWEFGRGEGEVPLSLDLATINALYHSVVPTSESSDLTLELLVASLRVRVSAAEAEAVSDLLAILVDHVSSVSELSVITEALHIIQAVTAAINEDASIDELLAVTYEALTRGETLETETLGEALAILHANSASVFESSLVTELIRVAKQYSADLSEDFALEEAIQTLVDHARRAILLLIASVSEIFSAADVVDIKLIASIAEVLPRVNVSAESQRSRPNARLTEPSDSHGFDVGVIEGDPVVEPGRESEMIGDNRDPDAELSRTVVESQDPIIDVSEDE